MDSYSINGNVILQGFRLENNGGLFQRSYTERGEWQTLKYFVNEQEAVQYALKTIKADEHSRKNYLGVFKNNGEAKQIIDVLKERGIEFCTDKILYGPFNDWRTRVFVIGCGIKKALDLKQ